MSARDSCRESNGWGFDLAILILLGIAFWLASCETTPAKKPIKIPSGFALTWFHDGSYRIWPADKARRADASGRAVGSVYGSGNAQVRQLRR